MVAAVPITMQVPNEREMPPSISFHSSSPMRPARFSSQYLQASEPEPKRVAAPVAAQHGAGRHINRRDAHRDRAHDEAGRGLVAAAHQYRAVDRMAAQQLLAFHRKEIAVEHRRRFDEGLGKRHRWQLDRKTAGLIDAAFDVLGAVAQMPMAGVDLAPGIDDADHRLAGPIGAVIAELAQPRAMAERAQIVFAEPAIAAQLFGRFLVLRMSCGDLLTLGHCLPPSVRLIDAKKKSPGGGGPRRSLFDRCAVTIRSASLPFVVQADPDDVVRKYGSTSLLDPVPIRPDISVETVPVGSSNVRNRYSIFHVQLPVRWPSKPPPAVQPTLVLFKVKPVGGDAVGDASAVVQFAIR